MHGEGFKRPQKITAVLRLKVNQNELECGIRAGGPLQLPVPQRVPEAEVGMSSARGLEGWENWSMKKASLRGVKCGQRSGNGTEGCVCVYTHLSIPEESKGVYWEVDTAETRGH